MLPPAKVSGTIINKAIIAEGCIIHAKEVTNSVIGIRSRIGKDTLVKNCSIGNDVQIKGGAHHEKVDHPLYTIKDGIVVIKKGAFIPNGFII